MIGWVAWMQILNKFPLFELFETFKILFWNINSLKLVKNSKKKKKNNETFPKIQFGIEIA